MTFAEIIAKKIHVRIFESDVKKINLHNDVVDLLKQFGMIDKNIEFPDTQNSRYTYASNVYFYNLEFMKDKISNFKNSNSRYSYEKYSSHEKSIRPNNQIREISVAIRNDNTSYLFRIDSLKSCSICIDANVEYFYPIYRVFKIFEKRRSNEKKKKNAFETGKLEHQLMGIALASELGLDELCKYDFLENNYEKTNVARTYYYGLTPSKYSHFGYTYLYSNDKWDTIIIKSHLFNSDLTLSKENTKKFLYNLKEIGEL